MDVNDLIINLSISISTNMVATEPGKPGKCPFVKKVSENLEKSGNNFGSVLVLMVWIPISNNVVFLTSQGILFLIFCGNPDYV